MENRYLDQHRQSQEDIYSIPSFGYYDQQWSALNSPWWCPELVPDHRSAFYKAEVALNCRQRKMNWVQREVASLEKKVICPDCFVHVVVHRSERELIQKVLERHQSGIVVMEESPEPFRVKRGVIEELYYGQEFDEYGRQVSNNYYGFGSDLAAFQRVPFASLEIIEFLKNLLLDDDKNPETVFEKRRYVQTVCEIFEVFDSYESEETAKSIWPDFDDRAYHLFEGTVKGKWLETGRAVS